MIEADRVRHPESATGLKLSVFGIQYSLTDKILTGKLSSKQWAQIWSNNQKSQLQGLNYENSPMGKCLLPGYKWIISWNCSQMKTEICEA